MYDVSFIYLNQFSSMVQLGLQDFLLYKNHFNPFLGSFNYVN